MADIHVNPTENVIELHVETVSPTMELTVREGDSVDVEVRADVPTVQLNIPAVTGPQGEQGPQGIQGEQGLPGHSPVITAESEEDGVTIYVDGVPLATIFDGESPIASVEKIDNTATITITDKYGTTYAEISDGTDGIDGVDGVDGQDGFSPSASVSKVGTVATITITDKDGTTTAQISDGTGSGDMLASVYDPNGGARQVAFADEIPTDYVKLTDSGAQTIQSNSAAVLNLKSNVYNNDKAYIGFKDDQNHNLGYLGISNGDAVLNDGTDDHVLATMEDIPTVNVTDVQLNSESIVSGGVATIPLITTIGTYAEKKIGAVKLRGYSGFKVDTDGALTVKEATATEITNRREIAGNNSGLLSPKMTNNIVKAALTDDRRITDLTDAEKANARDVIGAEATISDLATIRSGAALGATALQNVFTLVWANENPDVDFPAQTVSLDLSAYSFILISYRHGTNGNYQSTAIIPIDGSTHIIYVNYLSNNYNYKRGVTVTATDITFTTGYRQDTANKEYCIPLKIWGIK